MTAIRARLEPIGRWLATIAVAIFCALSVVAAPFGCAVGEYEENRNCDTSALSWAAVVVLVVSVVAAVTSRRRSVHWGGLALALVLAYAGALQA